MAESITKQESVSSPLSPVYTEIVGEQTVDTIINGEKLVTTAGTPVQVTNTVKYGYVFLKALSTNTGIIYVGNSSVSSANGYPLEAGEAISFASEDLSLLYIDSSVNGEGIRFFGSYKM